MANEALKKTTEREVDMYRPDVYGNNGVMTRPKCCGQNMEDDGGCSDGCCDDWKCSVCGRLLRTEAPD